MQNSLSEKLSSLTPIAAGTADLEHWRSDPAALFEAIAFFRGRFTVFDFSLRSSTRQGLDRQKSFIDSAARATEHFALDVGEQPPDYSQTEGLEKAYAVRQHLSQRLQALGPLCFAPPQISLKENHTDFYDEIPTRQAAAKLGAQGQEVMDMQSLWLYGSALQKLRQPEDLDFRFMATKAPSLQEYERLMSLEQKAFIGNKEVEVTFSTLDIPTWKAIYPFEEVAWPQTAAYDFMGHNQVFDTTDTSDVLLRTKLLQETINLYRMTKKLEGSVKERAELIKLCDETRADNGIQVILKARIRNVNLLTQYLRELGIEIEGFDTPFTPNGTTEEKLEAARTAFYQITEQIPQGL